MFDAEIFGAERAQQLLKGLGDQAPFAMASALTWMAKDVRASEQGHLREALDNPTPYTLKSIRIRPATKRNLEAFIWITDEAPKGTPPVKYLGPLIAGSDRSAKRFERALHRSGRIPDNLFAVPGRYARLNRYGNLSSGVYTRILSDLRASPDPMQNAPFEGRKKRGGKGPRSKRHFIIRKGSRPIGIYQRTGKRTLRSVLHFVSSPPGYSQHIDFEGVAMKVLERRGEQHLLRAIDNALGTAGFKSARTTDDRLLRPLLASARIL